jgi:hypothetical protein
MKVMTPPALELLVPASTARIKPQAPKPISKYAVALDGRFGRLATKSDLYVLLELHNDRLETPTVCLRLVPVAIAIESGLVLPEPQLGHLNLPTIVLFAFNLWVTLVPVDSN